VFQAGLILVLLVTVVINLTFIMETSKKLNKEPALQLSGEYIKLYRPGK
jgi:hypothetical protein